MRGMAKKKTTTRTRKANARHERFAQLVVAGYSQSAAYRKVYPASKSWKPDSLHSKASELAGKVSARVKELQAEGASQAIASKTELATFLTSIIRQPVGDVDETHQLAQEVIATEKMRRVKMPDKLGAVEKLARLMGYNEPDKIEETHIFKPDIQVFGALK